MNSHDHIRIVFEDAYDEFLDSIFRFLCSRLSNRERAHELTQETFMRAWQYLRAGNTITNMRPFLYTIAYNLFKNELRARREVYSLDRMIEERVFEPVSANPSSEEMLEQRMLVEMIPLLPEQYAEVLTLRFVDGLAVKDIAAMLEETPVAISVRIHRGIHKLRTRYAYERKTKTT